MLAIMCAHNRSRTRRITRFAIRATRTTGESTRGLSGSRRSLHSGKRRQGIAAKLCGDGSRLRTMASVTPRRLDGRLIGVTFVRIRAYPQLVSKTQQMFRITNGSDGVDYLVEAGQPPRIGPWARTTRRTRYLCAGITDFRALPGLPVFCLRSRSVDRWLDLAAAK
jgi:hypothetical protein